VQGDGQLDPGALQLGELARLGGTAPGNMGFGVGFDTDPGGTAPNRISSMVVGPNGQLLFNDLNRDIGRDNDQIQPQMQLEASRMVLAALQSSQLPQYLANVFKGVDAMTATQDQINALMQTAEALKSIYDLTSRDPVADAMQMLTDAMDPFNAALRNNGTAIRAVMDAYDGSATAATNLQQATLGYYNAQLQLINQLTTAKQSIDALFGDTFRGFKLAGMTDQQKYDFYQQEAKDLTAQALASTDPAEIQRLVQLINQDEQAAFALLTPEQQAGAAGQAFITQGQAAQHAIDDHIDSIKDAVVDGTRDVLNEIKTLITDPANSMTSAAKDMKEAGSDMKDAANKPLHVIVDNYGGGQEVTG